MNAIITLLLSLLYVHFIHGQDNNICHLQNQSIDCLCDMIGKHPARTVTCSVTKRVAKYDLYWREFNSQKNIEELIIVSKNDSHDIDFVPNNTLSTLKNLKKFVMRGCYLHTIRPYTFFEMFEIEEIHLEGNNIQKLEELSFRNLKKLKELLLSENKIKELFDEVLYSLPNLLKLYLDHNHLIKIANLAFFELPNLEELDLSNNQLHLLSPKTFVGLRSLKLLDLSTNKLTILDNNYFSGTTSLEELDIENNEINFIATNAFEGLKYLQVLKLSNNKLKFLSGNVFQAAPRLVTVNLTHNVIHKFHKGILETLKFENKQDFVIDLKGNPLECNCDLKYLLQVSEINGNHKLLKKMQDVACLMRQVNETNDEIKKSISDIGTKELNCPVLTSITATTTATTTTTTTRTATVPSEIIARNAAPPQNYLFSDEEHGMKVLEPKVDRSEPMRKRISHKFREPEPLKGVATRILVLQLPVLISCYFTLGAILKA